MILGLHHAALSVPDLDRALEFYSGRLGFEPVMRAEIPPRVEAMARAFGIDDSGCRVAMLKKGNSCIELFEFQAEDTPAGDPQRPVNQHGITHICLAVDDYASDYEELEKAGVQFNGPRGPFRIDPMTNNVIQNIYISEVQSVGDSVAAVVQEVIPNVRDEPKGCKL